MEPPIPPNEADCCNSGCNPCILDVYEDQLRKYNKNKTATRSTNCISATSYTIFKLINVTQHTKTTRLYTFEYVKPFRNNRTNDDLILFYEPGQHLLLRGGPQSDHFTRAYTPIPYGAAKLTFTVLIKLYDDGAMSRLVARWRVNDETLWRGPYGDFKIDYTHRNICLVAQGTGIAPIYAVVKQLLSNDECDTFLKLFYCCRRLADVPLRNELYGLSSFWNFRYEVYLTDGDGLDVKYNEKVHLRRFGKIDLEFYVKDVTGDVRFLICGSDGFAEAIQGYLKDLGIDSSQMFVF